MPPDFYKVEVIHHLDPHLIWVEVCDPSVTDEYKFEQVGIYGVLPLDNSLDLISEELKIQKCDVWTPAANKILKDILDESTEVWFSSAHIDRRSSIFDDNIHKYGELIIKHKNDKYKKVSKLLVKTNFAYINIGEFNKKLSSGNIKTKLSSIQVQEVVWEIEKFYIKNAQKKKALKQQTSVFQIAQDFESSLTITNVERHNKSVQKMFKNKAKDFELCKEVEEESVGRGFKYKPCEDNSEKSNSNVQNNVYNESLNDLKNFFNDSIKADKETVKDENKKETLLHSRRYLLDMLKQKKQVTTHESTQTNNEQIKSIIIDASDDGNNGIIHISTEYNKISQSDKVISRKMDVQKPHKVVAFDNNVKMEKATIHNKVKEPGRPKPDNTFNNMDMEKSCKMDAFENTCIMQKANTPKKLPKFSKTPQILYTKTQVTEQKHMAIGPAGLDQKHFIIKNFPIETNDEMDKTVKQIDFDRNEVFTDNAAEKDTIQTEKNTLNDYFTKLNNATELKHKEKEEQVKNEESNSSKSSKSSCSLLKRKLKVLQDLSKNKSSSCKDESVSEKNTSSDEDFDELLEKLNAKYKYNPVEKMPVNTPNDFKLKTNVNPFKNIDSNLSVFVDKLVTPVLMVHSKMNKRVQPVHTIRDINFNNHIHNILSNMSIESPMMLQSVSWSIILRGYSLFLISPLNSGKTMGYLPAVCRLVGDSTNSDSNGPIAIIICATARSVPNVAEIAKMFLGAEVSVLACYPGVDNLVITTTLLNGCDLLVSTPSSLFRLLQLTDFGVDLRRLSIFVLDDCERLFDVYANEIKFFQVKIKEMLKKRTNKYAKVQYVLASRTWFDCMESLALKAPDTVVCIGAFQECVLYSKTNVSVSFVKSGVKLNYVFDFLEEIDKSTKTVIVCKSDDEVVLLENVFKILKRVVFACNNKMTVHDLYNLSASWSEYEDPITGPILVCCDGNLAHMNVTDAHNLIQYSLPDIYSLFCKRFSVLNDNYPSIFNYNTNKVKIKIFVEENNAEQLPKIINFIKRCSDVPEGLEEVCKNNLIEKDIFRAKNLVPLCNTFLMLGRCPDIFNCQERHTILKDYDTPLEWMPKDGFVTFKILHYHSATLYSGRLLSNIVDGKITKFPQTFNDLPLKMGLFYSKESNRKLHGIPKVGDICAVSIKTNFYVRCRVVKILSTYERGNPNKVLIKLIDEEWFEVTRDIYLYHLPNELKSIQTCVAQIRLANLAPKDNDIAFSDLAMNYVRKIIDNDEDVFLRGHIALTFGNCIFVDTLKVCQDLKSLDATVEKHNIKLELLKDHAILNEQHIPYFQKLCLDSGLVVRMEEKVLEKETVKQITTEENVLTTEMSDKQLLKFKKSFYGGEDLVKSECIISKPLIRQDLEASRNLSCENSDLSKCNIEAQHTEMTNVSSLNTLPDKSDDTLKEESLVIESDMTEEINLEILNKNVQLGGKKTQDVDEIVQNSNIQNLPIDTLPDKIEDTVKEELLVLESNMTGETNLETLNINAQLGEKKTQDVDETAHHSNIENVTSNDILTESNEKVIKTSSKGNWASLQDNEMICVYLAYAISPDKFFLRPQESASSMASLLDDIAKYVANLQSNEVSINEGEFILAKYPDDCTYERARTISINNDRVKCFFLDHGDTMELPKDQLLPITDELIDKLPFQAIECRLFGVKPVHGEWIESTNDWFYEYCYENSNGKLKELFAKYYTKKTAEYTGDFEYGVVLFDTNSDKDIIVNQLMIDLDLALENNDEVQYLKHFDPNLTSSEESNSELTKTESQSSSLFLPQPIRSFPLVGSDDSDDDKWDVNIGEDFVEKFIPSLKMPENNLNERDNVEQIQQISKIDNLENKSKPIQTTVSVELHSDDLASSEAAQEKVSVKNIKLKDEIRRPKLLWRQNKSTITICILIDVDHYNLEIHSKSLKFSALLDNAKYEFDYELYGVIDKDKSSHDKIGLYVSVKLIKILEKNWLTLTRDGIKHGISYDVSTIDTSSDEDETNDRDFAKIITRKTSDDSESDDEDAPDDLNY